MTSKVAVSPRTVLKKENKQLIIEISSFHYLSLCRMVDPSFVYVTKLCATGGFPAGEYLFM